MVTRLRLLAALLAALLVACGKPAPGPMVGSDYPVPQGPASINGVDAGSYPHLALTLPALPLCDGGEGYQRVDGGMGCRVAGGGSSGIDAAVSLPLIGNGTAAHPITTESCDAGEFLGGLEAGVPHCAVPPHGSSGLDAATSGVIVGNGTAASPITGRNCDAGEFFGALEAGAPHCAKPPGGSSLTAAPPLYIDGGVIDLHPVAIDAGTVGALPLQRLQTGGTEFQALVYGDGGLVQAGCVDLASGSAVCGLLPMANAVSPTGTGLTKVVAGATAAAALGGSEFQVYQINDAGVPIVGPVAIDAGTVGALPLKRLQSGGTEYSVLVYGDAGLVIPGCVQLGLIGEETSNTAVCGTLAAGNQAAQAMGGDVSGTTASATVTQAQAGELLFGATTGTITAKSTATAPGLAQASESTTTQPTIMALTPQVSTHATNQGGSEVGVYYSPQAGSGTEGGFIVNRAGTTMAAIGVPTGYGGYGFLWLGANAQDGTRSSSNYALSNVLGATVVNSTAGTSGFAINGAYVLEVNSSTAEVDIAATYNLSVGAMGGTFGGMTNGVYEANGTATTSGCTGGTCIGSTTAGLIATSATFDVDTLSPASTSGTGGFGSGVRKYPEYRIGGMATTSYSPGFQMPIPATSVCNLDYIAEARCTNALGACSTVGVGASATFTVRGAVVKNISGTASIVTTSGIPSATTVGDNGAVSMGCALSAATTFVTLACGLQSNAQTSDWTIRAKLNCN